MKKQRTKQQQTVTVDEQLSSQEEHILRMRHGYTIPLQGALELHPGTKEMQERLLAFEQRLMKKAKHRL